MHSSNAPSRRPRPQASASRFLRRRLGSVRRSREPCASCVPATRATLRTSSIGASVPRVLTTRVRLWPYAVDAIGFMTSTRCRFSRCSSRITGRSSHTRSFGSALLQRIGVLLESGCWHEGFGSTGCAGLRSRAARWLLSGVSARGVGSCAGAARSGYGTRTPERNVSTLWTCSRVTDGVRCGFRNPGRKRKCLNCGKPRPAKKRPAHMAALDLGYDVYVALNGTECCGICGKPPGVRRHHRDHDHGSGEPRGLLCPPCNRALVAHRYGLKVTAEWLAAAAAYLQRSTAQGGT